MGITYIPTDVSVEEQVVNALKVATQKLGKLDVVINNVGIYGVESLFDGYPSDTFDKIIDVNMKGVFYGLKHAPLYMNDGGTIINTTSQTAYTNIPGNGPYGATKTAVLSMTKSAALELAPRKIRVNGVAPTIVDTPFIELSEPERKLGNVNIPLGRVSIAEDLPGVYHFLAAEESAFITGHILIVDGGWTAGLSYALLEKTMS